MDEKPAVSPTTEIKSKAVEETWLGGLILLLTWVEVALVVLYFMELRKAHLAWLMILGLILIIYSGFIWSLKMFIPFEEV